MNKYKRYYGLIIFIVTILLAGYFAYNAVVPMITEQQQLEEQRKSKQSELDQLKRQSRVVAEKIKKIKDSIVGSQKKIYSPQDADLGNDTLFFTLYNDLIEMVQANSVKIKSIKYEYNPESDAFVSFGKDVYFVCDINMELVSNFVNLGKLIQDIHQYPYYIKINSVAVESYKSDKKILLTKLSLRLYAHTEPDTEDAN